MKNEVLNIAFILLPIGALSYEINFNKTFSKVVTPDLLTAQTNISARKRMTAKVVTSN